MKEPPTGIIRTLPSLYTGGVGGKAYQRSVAAVEAGTFDALYIALAQQPKHDLLHLYICLAGEVNIRFNVAGYEPGDSRKCWDRTIREPKVWVACTGPISRPRVPVKMRGFQGFRYVFEPLW